MNHYKVLSYTLNGEAKDVDTYRHDAPFVEGDTRVIQYEGDDFQINQTFYGTTAAGGWYDNE
jgi:hypothetical protein